MILFFLKRHCQKHVTGELKMKERQNCPRAGVCNGQHPGTSIRRKCALCCSVLYTRLHQASGPQFKIFSAAFIASHKMYSLYNKE